VSRDAGTRNGSSSYPVDAFDTLAGEQMPVMNRESMNDFSSTPMRPKYAYSVSRIAALIAAIFAPPLKMNFIFAKLSRRLATVSIALFAGSVCARS
jgi:hypothetical protein